MTSTPIISRLSPLLALPLLMSAGPRVGALTLAGMVEASDVVVVASVVGIEETTPGRAVASADVLETWKGETADRVDFLATRTWVCDTSTAVLGETVVLFLRDGDDPDLLRIVHSGRGRMPVDEFEGVSTCTVWVGDVVLPSGTTTFEGPEPEYSFIRRVERETLRGLVATIVAETPARGTALWTTGLVAGVSVLAALAYLVLRRARRHGQPVIAAAERS